jgi:hypothetical protein
MKNKKTDQQKRLKSIEIDAFEMGFKASKSYKNTGNFSALRGAVIAYRCSMQAMRDQMRYTMPMNHIK